MEQLTLFSVTLNQENKPFKLQLLKWIGNKQRFAQQIISYLPLSFGTYFEPFLGSGAVLGSLAPKRAIGSDTLLPLVEIWHTLHAEPETLKTWYQQRWQLFSTNPLAYEQIKADYNANPNGADLLFLSRSCYGGVVRFRTDGYMSTPKGVHQPISPDSFAKRVDIWHQRTQGTHFVFADFESIMDMAKAGDLIYCDPPYIDTQSILYGAQSFSLQRLFHVIERSAARGVYVAMSLDASKKAGKKLTSVTIPSGLFKREVPIHVGRSMLRRFQMEGQTLESEIVTDRLLLTY